MPNPVQYIILNTSVEMSPGKAAAQAAHAAVYAFHKQYNGPGENSEHEKKLLTEWLTSQHYAKIILGAPDLFVAERYIENRFPNIARHMVIDEGKTEFTATHTPTALGYGVVDKDTQWVKDAFGGFKTYKGYECPNKTVESQVKFCDAVLAEITRCNNLAFSVSEIRINPAQGTKSHIWGYPVVEDPSIPLGGFKVFRRLT